MKQISEAVKKDQILYYFKTQWPVLLAVTFSGLIYNLGLLAGPWFEGRMTGCLVDILGGKAGYQDMLVLVTAYVMSIAIVQISRYIKRFYVRRFANNVNRDMKEILYRSLVHRSRAELEEEGAGNVMTKAILDVDDCAEGMRKFTTEIFDTGVALAAYVGMLLFYDWRLAILGMLFLPVSYVLAEKMKRNVQRTGAAYKEKSGDLSAATLDRATNAITYCVYGREKERRQAYEANLTDYETSAVKANIWSTAFPPLYRIISMTGVLFILYFGSRNVLGTGWKIWDVAAFTTFLSCFLKLAVKSSHAAKLFNAVHKAQVSWKRIKPLMKETTYEDDSLVQEPGTLEVSDVSFAYPSGEKIYEDFNLSATPGQIIGVTGAGACGKSTLGKTFLCEYPYEGRICFHGKELSGMTKAEQNGMVGYLGHDPELFNDSVRNNILLGDDDDPEKYLKAVCFDGEVAEMEEDMDTIVGNGGVRLSGGHASAAARQARRAGARALAGSRVGAPDRPAQAPHRAARQAVRPLRPAAAARNESVLPKSRSAPRVPALPPMYIRRRSRSREKSRGRRDSDSTAAGTRARSPRSTKKPRGPLPRSAAGPLRHTRKTASRCVLPPAGASAPAGTPRRSSVVAPVVLVENDKALEQQIAVVDDLAAAHREDEPRDAARGDDGGLLAKLFFDALDHAVDHAGIAQHDAAAHRVDRIAADGLFRHIEADARQLRGAAGKRFGRDLNACADAAADIGAVFVHDGDRRCRAHVDHDERRLVFMQRRHGTDHKVAADGGGIVEQDIQPGLDAGADDERLFARQLHDRRAHRV